jgi:hypothetical protein
VVNLAGAWERAALLLEQHTGERRKQEHRNIAAPPKAIAMSREHHAIAIFSRAKASFTATERSLRS